MVEIFKAMRLMSPSACRMLFCGAWLMVQSCYANTAEGVSFQAGVHYQVIDRSLAVPTPKPTVRVEEYFSYGCPHCYNLDPAVKSWVAAKPDYIQFEHKPAFWNASFKLLAHAHYTAVLLNKEKRLSDALFQAIHQRRMRFNHPSQLKSLFSEHGVTEAVFDKTFDSFAVRQKVKMSDNAFKRYQLKSVPTFVIGGYYTTSVSMAGGEQPLFEVIEYLAKKLYAP